MTLSTVGNDVFLPTMVGGTPFQAFPAPHAVCMSAPTAITQFSVDGRPVTPRSPSTMMQLIQSFEGVDVTLMARPATAERQIVVRSMVDAITLLVFDLVSDDPADPIHTEELDVDTAMLTAAYLDGGWNCDTKGYTFKHKFEGGDGLFEGGRMYRLEFLLLTSSHGTIPVVGQIQTHPLYASRSQL